MREHDDGAMRERIVRVAMVAVAAALVLFAVPLAVLVRASFFDQAHRELERAALAAAVRVGPHFASTDPAELPVERAGRQVGVYDLHLRLQAGDGPVVADAVTRKASAGVIADGQVNDALVAAVPVSSAEDIVGVVRASVSTGAVWLRVAGAWVLLTLLATLALVVAVLVARRQARLLSEPLEALSATSQRVADGDLTARAEVSAIPEIHRLARTHNAMLDRLTQLLDTERHFSADASHQLRTPLAGLQLGLEAALASAHRNPDVDSTPALLEASAQVRRLSETVEEFLRLTKLRPSDSPAAPRRPIVDVLADIENRWHGPLAGQGRRLSIRLPADLAAVPVPGGVAAQILDVLLDNTLRHGRGVVMVSVHEMGEAVTIRVSDEGSLLLDSRLLFQRGTSGGAGHGIGLALARSMAEGAGGRLYVVQAAPTTFGVTLPTSDGLSSAATAGPEADQSEGAPRC